MRARQMRTRSGGTTPRSEPDVSSTGEALFAKGWLTETEGHAPDDAQVVVAKDPEEDERDESLRSRSGFHRCPRIGRLTAITKPAKVHQRRSGKVQSRRDPPQSIMVLVAKANNMCWYFLLTDGSSVFSAAPTEPLGYSAPMPMPPRKR